MSNEFKRMQQLAGINEVNIEPSFRGGPFARIMEEFEEPKHKYPELYKGFDRAINSSQFKQEMKELEKMVDDEYQQDWEPDSPEDTWEDHKQWYLGDFDSVPILDVWGDQFIQNLLDAGFAYDGEEVWTVPEKYQNDFTGEGLTGYGIIWEFWKDMDTDPRERTGDYFEEITERYFETH
jgi:hypothetical protein